MAVVLPGSFIYLAHMHTGSTVVADALKKIDGAFTAYNKRKGIGHHATLEEVKRVCGDQLTGTETIFTTVRHPYEVLVHMFLRNHNHFQMRALERRLRREPTFREFVELWVEFNQRPYMHEGRLFYHDTKVHLRHERLQVEIDTLFRRIPNTPGSVPLAQQNTTPGKDHWSFYFDDPTYAYVNSQFQQDLVKFGYSFVWSKNALV